MDDLTLLRELRANEPGPSAAESTFARHALLAAIAAAAAPRGVTSGQSRAARFLTGWRRIWIPVVAASAAVVTGLAALALSPDSGRFGGPAAARTSGPAIRHATVTAAFVLRQAAASAASQHPGSGRYFFTESEYVADELSPWPSSRWDGPYLRRVWLASATKGLLEDPRVSHLPMPMPPGVDAGNRVLTWDQLRHLPTSPGPLEAVIAKLAYGSPHETPALSEFGTISGLLSESPTPPALQAALYRLAATLPGIKLVPGAHDLVGRAATEVYMPGGWNLPGGGGQALFFDPATGSVLGIAQITGNGPQCPPLWSTAVLATGYVNSTGQLPPGTPPSLEPVSFAKTVPGCPALGPTSRN